MNTCCSECIGLPLAPSRIALTYIHVSCRTIADVAKAEIDREQKLLDAHLDAEAQKAAAAAKRDKAKLEFQLQQRREQLKQQKELMQMQMAMSVVHNPPGCRGQPADLMPTACCVVGTKNRRSTTSGWRT